MSKLILICAETPDIKILEALRREHGENTELVIVKTIEEARKMDEVTPYVFEKEAFKIKPYNLQALHEPTLYQENTVYPSPNKGGKKNSRNKKHW